MPSLDEIMSVLKTINIKEKLGVAGSYARGTEHELSDIDVVVDTDLLTITDIELIKETLLSHFGKESDVICLGLLRCEDEKLDKLLISYGLAPNEDSAYKSILREVIWCE